jgi:hypothetical protein
MPEEKQFAQDAVAFRRHKHSPGKLYIIGDAGRSERFNPGGAERAAAFKTLEALVHITNKG